MRELRSNMMSKLPYRGGCRLELHRQLEPDHAELGHDPRERRPLGCVGGPGLTGDVQQARRHPAAVGLAEVLRVEPKVRAAELIRVSLLPGDQPAALKVKNGRKNVKSTPYRPILSANRRRQRPTAV